MLDRQVLLVSALAFLGSHALALPVHVTFEWPAGTPASTLSHVHIHAVRNGTSGSANNAAPIETDVSPNGAILKLSNGVWQVQAFAPEYWSQETEVMIDSQESAKVRLSLWPAASLHGEITTTEGELPPLSLTVRLSAAPASPNEKITVPIPAPKSSLMPSHAELSCQIANETWRCLGPTGLFDVQMEASGYAPRYEWGMNLKAAENTDLGRIVLRRASSVFGRVVRRDGSNPPVPCRASLQPDMERLGPGENNSERAPTDEASFSVPLNQRGYFQVVGVQAGKHVLTVACAEASGFREFVVQADGETRIDPPLQLEELPLDIAVTPKLDPAGQPWQITVDETAPRYVRIANKATTSADGRWSRRGLMTGNYHVFVRSSDGTLWLQQYFNLRANSEPLSLRLASVKVAGHVMMSSMPVRARLVFSNNAGGQSATLMSDNDGRFQGILPVTPNIQETSSWTVEAHVAQPPVDQRLLGVNVPIGGAATKLLDLELPTIPVRGSVVSEDGQAQRGVQVTFEDSSGVRTTTSTDGAGNFEMSDLPPGKYTAMADSPEGTSDRTPFDVTGGNESNLKLVLNPSMRAPFYVVSSDGPVVNAAVQVWIKPGVPRAFAHTDQNGRFEVTLPPGTTEVALTVGAPGYAIKLTRLKISSESAIDDSPNSANTVSLDNSGGTLMLNVHPPGRTPEDSAMLYLVHNGAIQDALSIAGWGSEQTGAIGNGPEVVKAIEPGKYAVCRIANQSQLSALWSDQLPSDRCRSGSLEQGETLTLSPQ